MAAPARMARLVLILVTMAMGIGATATIPAADWPCWRGPHHNGVIPAEPLRTDWSEASPPVLWRAQVGTGFSSVVVSGGRVYTLGHTGDEDAVVCLNADSGEVAWRQTYPAPLDPNLFEGGPTATPTVDGNDLYTFSRQGLAICWDATTGAERWRTNVATTCEINIPSWGFSGSPVVFDGRVLFNAGSAGLALDRHTGQVLWKSDNSEDAAYATPLLVDFDGRRTALILSGKAIHALDPHTGTPFWDHRWITRYGVNAADPLVEGHHIWLTSGYSKGTSLLKAGEAAVEEVWRSRALRNQMSPGVLIDGCVYAVDGDENADRLLKCLDFLTGEVRWESEELGSATLIGCGSKLLLLSDTGELVLAEATPERFHLLARGPVLTGKCWTPPALSNGRVYCRNALGEVVCIDLRP